MGLVIPYYTGISRVEFPHPHVVGGKQVLGAVAFPDRFSSIGFGADCLKHVVVYIGTGGRAVPDGNAGQYITAIGGFLEGVVVDQVLISGKVAAILVLVDIEMVTADSVPVAQHDVIPGFILLSGQTGTGDGMTVVVKEVGFNEGISAIQVDTVAFTAGLVVVDVIVVDVGDGRSTVLA